VTVPALHSQSLSREQIDLVKRTIANGASNDELQMFLHLADKYSLDPFAKEIHFSKMGGRPSFIVARDGYLKIAMLDPGYNGLQSMVVRKGDHFEIDAEGNRVIHKFGTDRGEILGAWAVARHKQRPPVICFVEFSEYKQASPIWTKYPSAMIQKVAEVFVLRRQFTISGLVSQEEITYDMAPAESHKSLPLPTAEVEVLDAKGEVIDRTDTSETVTEETTTPPTLPTPKPPKLITDAQRKRLFAIATEHNWTDAAVKDELQNRGYTSSKEIKVAEYDAICRFLVDFAPVKESDA
jgi:phage recombination protein Bet